MPTHLGRQFSAIAVLFMHVGFCVMIGQGTPGNGGGGANGRHEIVHVLVGRLVIFRQVSARAVSWLVMRYAEAYHTEQNAERSVRTDSKREQQGRVQDTMCDGKRYVHLSMYQPAW